MQCSASEGWGSILGDLRLTGEGYKDAIATKVSFVKGLLTQSDLRLQNPAYKHLKVADYWLWKSALQQETD